MTNPNGARTRIRDWYKAYTSAAVVDDTLAVSFAGRPLYASDLLALVEAFDKPCGSCHPCDNWADETWRAAGRKPPHVYEWDEARRILSEIRDLVDNAEHAAVSVAALRKVLAS